MARMGCKPRGQTPSAAMGDGGVGVALPPRLLALAALREDLLMRTAAPQ